MRSATAPAADDVIARLLPADAAAWRALVPRRRLLAALGAAAVALTFVVLGGPARTFADALARAMSADPGWLAAAAGLEALSIAGYVVLLWRVGGAGPGASYRIALGGTAATRLLPIAGGVGVALSVWALRRTGRSTAAAGAVFLRFLVLLYAAFLVALLAGGALALGLAIAAGSGPLRSRSPARRATGRSVR
jgi:uncharacterized membrane protein YbhN (UPF0104 family)